MIENKPAHPTHSTHTSGNPTDTPPPKNSLDAFAQALSNSSAQANTATQVDQPAHATHKPSEAHSSPATSVNGSGQPPKPPVSTSPTPATATPPEKPKKKRRTLWMWIVLILMIILGGLAFLAFSVTSYVTTVFGTLAYQASSAQTIANEANERFKAQDLPGTQAKINELAEQIQSIENTYKSSLEMANSFPISRDYYQDGLHGITAAKAGVAAAQKAINAVTPYADVLGFTGEGTFTGGTAEDRLKIILGTLDKVSPELDAIVADLKVVEESLSQIDPNDYPEQLMGFDIPYAQGVKNRITEGKDVMNLAVDAVTRYRPIIEKLPEIAGGETRKKYLVIFQNDNELRPTGGFLTAYAIIFVEDGKVTLEKSDDIYELDKKYAKKAPIPAKLGKYLTTEKSYNIRDMNIDPDFKVSMDEFFAVYSKLPGEHANVDGIIAIDTHMLTDLLTVLGPVEVPGYGTFSAEMDPTCNCPQVIHALSEIITRPTPYIKVDRKGILGPMMRAILTKSYSAPRTYFKGLSDTAFKAIENRHVQMYFFDPEIQQAVEAIHAAGRMNPPKEGEDFIAIINANLGGAKSNLFVKYDTLHTVSAPENGKITHTVKITYTNPEPGDDCNLERGLLCLNSTLRDWTRIYLPKDAKLVSSKGFTKDAESYSDDRGFTVVDGYFILEPKSQASVEITYELPYTGSEYVLNIWKQAGIHEYGNIVDVNGNQEELKIEKGETQYKSEF